MSDPQSLKNMGLKATFPRLKILELFETSTLRHMSAEDVYKMLIAENMDTTTTWSACNAAASKSSTTRRSSSVKTP